MPGVRRRALGRAGLWALLLTAAAGALLAAGPGLGDLALVAGDPAGWARRRGVDGAVVDVLALLAWAGLLWLLVGAVVAVLAHVPGTLGRAADRLAHAVTPALVRRLVEALLGATALTGVVATGTAAAAPPPPTASGAWTVGGPGAGVPAAGAPTVGVPAVAGIGLVTAPVPATHLDWPVAAHLGGAARVDADWPVTSGHDTSAPRPATAGEAPPATGLAEVVVARGDTLWSIAARHLGPEAGDEEISRSWPAWHDANRDVIGPDPDRLLPGQRLLPPA